MRAHLFGFVGIDPPEPDPLPSDDDLPSFDPTLASSPEVLVAVWGLADLSRPGVQVPAVGPTR